MTRLKKDTTNRKLGRKPHVCRICGAEGDFDTFLVREMMQGTRDEFHYFVCGRCQCLQIAEVPENLGDYYGSNYYSFQMSENPDMKFATPVRNEKKVLDVGCGAGVWLFQKAMEGWGNLYGCDPFLEHSRHYGSRVTIYNCSIHEMEGDGTFDIVRMSDSFEHMTDPLEALQSACRLLKPDGTLHMMIPTYPNIAFERFGAHWYQLDAPRHIFLHSRKSLKWLSKASGLAITKIRYDSNNSQFMRSYFYQRGITFFEQTPELASRHFSSREFQKMNEEAALSNEQEYGDHMEVFWQKSEIPDIAFCSFLESGEEERALEILPRISLEEVKSRRNAVLTAGLSAGDRVYEAFLSRLTAMQWEVWSGEILDAFAASLAEEDLYEQQSGRLPGLLAEISVPSIIAWVEQSVRRREGRLGNRLFEYAMEFDMQGSPVQELCLCAWILKEAYVKMKQEENGRAILYRYVSVMGAFAGQYYRAEHLTDAASHAVPPDICAACRMALALADGKAESGNIAILKEALELFPGFHEEIRSIIKELR